MPTISFTWKITLQKQNTVQNTVEGIDTLVWRVFALDWESQKILNNPSSYIMLNTGAWRQQARNEEGKKDNLV